MSVFYYNSDTDPRQDRNLTCPVCMVERAVECGRLFKDVLDPDDRGTPIWYCINELCDFETEYEECLEP